MQRFFNKLFIGIGFLWTALANAQSTTEINTLLLSTVTYNYAAQSKVSFKPGSKYKPNSGQKLNAHIDEKIIVTNTPTALTPNMRQVLNTDLEVGSTPGMATVNMNGQSIYTIPVFASPGTAGVQPQLNIQYHSQRDMGTLGYGWDITGLSAITRAGQNMYYDNAIQGITFTNADAFIYDGQRIIPTTGTTGADNTEYGTESESFVKIISHGVTGSGPTWFEVKTKDGSVLEFGNTTDSRFMGLSGTVLTWRINKLTDANGNYMLFTYTSEANEQVISRIDYTGNAIAGIAPYNSIEFYYDRNADSLVKYTGGRRMVTSLLLRKLRCFAEGNLAEEYDFTYGKDLYTKLTEIRESGKSGESYNSTLINWGASQQSMTQGELANPIAKKLPCVNIADENGDGKSDVIAFDKDYVVSSVKEPSYVIFQSGAPVTWDNWIPYGLNSTAPLSISVLDDDYDNRDDIYRLDYSSGSFSFNRHSSTPNNNGPFANYILSWSAPSVGGANLTYENITLVPVNFSSNNGNPAILALRTIQRNGPAYHVLAAVFSSQGYVVPPATGLFKENSPGFNYTRTLKFADLNGDGKTEIIELSNSQTSPYINVYAFDEVAGYQLATPNANLGYWDYLEFGDFNGDGNADMLQHGADGSTAQKKWRVFYYTGTGWQKAYDFTQLDALAGNNLSVYINDMNKDGRTDLFCVPVSNTLSLLLSSGTQTFTRTDYSILGMEPGRQPLFGDFDGNGIADLYIQMKKYDQTKLPYAFLYDQYNYIMFTNGAYGNLVSNVIDGYNNVSRFDYTIPATRYATDYLRVPDQFRGLRAACPSFQVKTLYKQNVAGTENYEQADFTYAQPIFNTFGKGFLGFQTITKTTTWGGITNTNESETYHYALNTTNAFLYLDYVNQAALQYGSDVNHSRTEYVYEMAPGVSGNKRYWQRVTKETSYDYLTGLTFVADYLKYDSSGNVLTLKKQNSGTGTVPVMIESGYITVPVAGPFANRPSSQKITYGAGTETGSVRTTNFTYDTRGNLLTKVQDPAQTKALTTKYEYNNCGLPTKQTLSGNGVADRVNRYEYDSKNRFVLNTYNALSQKTERTYEPAFGNVLTQKSIDGKSVSWQYNNLGRMVSATDRFGTVTIYTQAWESSAPSQSIYYESVVSPEAPDAKVWYDNLGRKIKSSVITPSGDVAFTDYKVDNRFLLTQQSRPHTSDQPSSQWITYNYDEFKRPTQLVDNGKQTTIEYSGKTITTTRVVDPMDASKNMTSSQVLNDDGQVGSITDNAGTIAYQYWQNGQVKSINAMGALTNMEYDAVGNQSKLEDADAGVNQYEYNAFGEMTKQTHPDNATTMMEYDVLGNLTKKTHNNPAGIQPEATTYTYVSSGGGINRPSVITGISTTQNIVYNDYGQVTSVKEITNGQSFTTAYAYSNTGQHQSTTYPSGLVIKKGYDGFGRVNQLTQVSGSAETMLWRAANFNLAGQITQALLGTGQLKYDYTYDANYQLTGTSLKNTSSAYVYQYQYVFDYATGNLTQRKNVLDKLTETFTYDNMDRLLTTSVNGVTQQILSYAGNGNVQSKSNVSSTQYVYNVKPPHAVASIPPPLSVTIPSFTQTTTYNVAKRVTNITQGRYVMNFTYGPDDERRMAEYKDSTTTLSTRYYNGDYEKEITPTGTKEYHYIYSPYGMVAMIIRNGGNDSTYFTCTDHLGTIQALARVNGTIAEKYSTDAWGTRRNPTNWTYVGVPTPTLTNRCYTGHEHLDKFGLINMNARMFDPVIARMLSPDNYVQDPFYSQSFNRYSYVWNNPLKYFDLTGNATGSPGDPVSVNLPIVFVRANRMEPPRVEDVINWKWLPYIPGGGDNGGSSGGGGMGQGGIVKRQRKTSSGSNTPWMEFAQSQLGQRELRPGDNPVIISYHATTGGFKDDETSWCSSFVNWSITQAGLKGTNSAKALSWSDWGESLNNPAYGSIAVIDYGRGRGHVGFVVGVNNSGRIILLGGNQSDMVKYSAFSETSISRFVYPSGYIPSYTLPVLNIGGGSSFHSTR